MLNPKISFVRFERWFNRSDGQWQQRAMEHAAEKGGSSIEVPRDLAPWRLT